jgi:AbiV family abortive infection protein
LKKSNTEGFQIWKRGPPVSYPVSAIPEGVLRCLEKSEQTLQSATALWKLDQRVQALVLYIAALEEFGKALLLIEKRKLALEDGCDTIRDDRTTFSCHELRLETVRRHRPVLFGAIDVDAVEAKWLGEVKPEHFKFMPPELMPMKVYDVLSFLGRNSLLYVDYDIEKGKWKEDPELPTFIQMDNTFHLLREEIWKVRDKQKSLRQE